MPMIRYQTKEPIYDFEHFENPSQQVFVYQLNWILAPDDKYDLIISTTKNYPT